MGARMILKAFLLAAVAAGCGAAPATTPEPTPHGTISPGAGLNAAEQLLVWRLPAWVDRAGCKGSVGVDASSDLAASLVCSSMGFGDEAPAWIVEIRQRRFAETGDAFLARAQKGWRINTPEVTPAPGCAEGPWIGRWDDNGEIVGVLVCTGEPGRFEFRWLDERTGLYGYAVFGSQTWADAYRSWRQSGLADMTSPR